MAEPRTRVLFRGLLFRGLLPWGWILLLGGCGLFGARQDAADDDTPAFSHAQHVGAEEIECADCHKVSRKTGKMRLPSLRKCQLCHDGIDEEKAPAQRATALFEGKKLKRHRVARLDDEVVFAHKVHASETCDSCHPGIGESQRVGGQRAPAMDQCTDCHEQRPKPVPPACGTCHTRVSTKVAPKTHDPSWELRHGLVVRAGFDEPANRCSSCHTEASCVDCHRNQPPVSHDVLWRQQGHGLEFSMDRQRCQTCHTTDTCVTCHQRSAPLSHGPGWGSPGDLHCVGCHLSGGGLSSGGFGGDGCGLCHQGAPSHAMAPPPPPSHRPGMNCRQCHGIEQALPHLDTGVPCNACHR